MSTVKPAEHGAGTGGTDSPLAAEVFDRVADRLAERTEDVALFAETGADFDQWIVWEAVAACRGAGWTPTPRPRYADVGVAGSRDDADLLVFDPATGRRVLIEIAVIHDWTTNKWIAELDRDTGRLEHAPVSGLQLVIAAALASPVEVNATWRGWLALARIWGKPTKLDRGVPLGPVGQLLLRGWTIG